MYVKSLECANYRNIEHEILQPCQGVNLIYGENAQGKTNLIESIWLFTGCRSFRSTKDSELIKFGEKKAILNMDFYASERDQTAKIEIAEKRTFELNNIKKTSASRIMGEFISVVFSPVHLNLIKGSPSERRKFIDIAISQLKPKYAVTISQYNKAIAQRNTVLKEINKKASLYDTLDIWEERIAFFASEIIKQRISYIKKLEQFCQEIYIGLSSGKEIIEVTYSQKNQYENQENKQEIYEKIKIDLKNSRKVDLIYGSTSVGPHRDDLEIKINKLSAKIYGSQGQQRSAALTLKLAEAAVIQDFSDEKPIALLDDVMSELDTNRQNYILNHIKDWQVFISCCDPSTVQNLSYGKAFEVREGQIVVSN
ncbi:MAG: DNA replication/repair protein RecF [Clostridia bacterium]